MASLELTKLYHLFQIDNALVEIKKKAATLEAGKKHQADLEAFRKAVEAKQLDFHRVHGELKDQELTVQQLSDKLKSIDKKLFDGSVTNPKEIEAFETQKVAIKKSISDHEDKILSLMDELPQVQKVSEEATKQLETKSKQFEEWKLKAVKFKQQLEAQHKDLMTKRPKATEGISPMLMAKYDTIRQRHHGIGMAVVTRQMTCEECGNAVAEKSIQAIQDDRIVQCEDCQRILYWTGGVV